MARTRTPAPTLEDAQWLEPHEVAKLLRVSPVTLKTWRHLRKGPPYVVVGGKMIRYRLKDIIAWQADQIFVDGSLR